MSRFASSIIFRCVSLCWVLQHWLNSCIASLYFQALSLIELCRSLYTFGFKFYYRLNYCTICDISCPESTQNQSFLITFGERYFIAKFTFPETMPKIIYFPTHHKIQEKTGPWKDELTRSDFYHEKDSKKFGIMYHQVHTYEEAPEISPTPSSNLWIWPVLSFSLC